MRLIRKLATAFLLASIATTANGVVLGYITGNEYLKLSESERTMWLVGTMDGMMAEDTFVTKNPNGPWLGRCIGSLPITQVKAIFEQELKSKPEGWHAPAALAFRQRMEHFCQGRQ